MAFLMRPWTASCEETRERMSDYLEGELAERERKRVFRHLARCERCRAVLESLTRALDQLRALGRLDAAQPSSVTVEAVVERIRRDDR